MVKIVEGRLKCIIINAHMEWNRNEDIMLSNFKIGIRNFAQNN